MTVVTRPPRIWRCYHYADLQGGLVCAVLDDLVVDLYGTADELLGELVCLAVAQGPIGLQQ